MDQIAAFFTSLSVEQIALGIGGLTFLVHTFLDRNNLFSKQLNLFIVRATTLVVPVATAAATDPNVSGLVHSYFPALLGFFTAYQGLYHLTKAAIDKWNQIKLMAKKPADQTA